ncbi:MULTISPECIES: hypothetical protein [unclassified Spirillospora]|uniref:hypothetical protein n=1 Tax=unclassified Spirillospora TaxID=2642701 RepID=UPI0037218E2E
MPSEPNGERFGFAFDRPLPRPLRMLGIRPETCYLLITTSRLDVRFGRWSVRTALDNVAGAEVTGPFSAWKVLGVHLSAADRGLTFGTGTEQGVCIRFHRPVPGAEPTGLLRHPGLTLTLADSPAAARRLQEIASALHPVQV